MGFFNRLYNLWSGFLSVFIGRMEEKHPEIAYENAINGMTEKYTTLKTAAAGLIKHRAQLEARISKTEKGLDEIKYDIQAAVDAGEDEVALTLLEKQEELESALADYKRDLGQAAKDAETAKESLRSIQKEIEKLKSERDRVVAQIKDAEARKQINEQLDGLSVEDDIKALGNVREYADRVRAEASVGDELRDESLEGKLASIRKVSGSSKAKSRLDALKAKRAGGASAVAEPEGGKTL